jgi:hypothetical protein
LQPHLDLQPKRGCDRGRRKLYGGVGEELVRRKYREFKEFREFKVFSDAPIPKFIKFTNLPKNNKGDCHEPTALAMTNIKNS